MGHRPTFIAPNPSIPKIRLIMAKKFSARWKATGFQPGNSTQFILSGDIPQSMAVRISECFFRCYCDQMLKTYPELRSKPRPRKLSITINFP